jgi:hypothetical protein
MYLVIELVQSGRALLKHEGLLLHEVLAHLDLLFCFFYLFLWGAPVIIEFTGAVFMVHVNQEELFDHLFEETSAYTFKILFHSIYRRH